MNKPVSYSIAKLLKEKGFNEPCQFLRVGGKYRINHENEGDLFDNQFPSTQIPNDWFLAPTIADVVMWLFESHNIWIYLTREPITNTFGPVINTETKSIYFNNQSTVSRVTGQKYDPWYNKPENGYQKAIEYVLTEMI